MKGVIKFFVCFKKLKREEVVSEKNSEVNTFLSLLSLLRLTRRMAGGADRPRERRDVAEGHGAPIKLKFPLQSRHSPITQRRPVQE